MHTSAQQHRRTIPVFVFLGILGLTHCHGPQLVTPGDLPTAQPHVAGRHQALEQGSLTAAGTLNISHAAHTETLLGDGTVLFTGGTLEVFRDFVRPVHAVVETYDPGNRNFTVRNAMSTPRGLHSATLLGDGTVLVAGGEVEGLQSLATAEIYQPNTGTLIPTSGNLITPRQAHAAAILPNGEVLLAGGYSGSLGRFLDTAEIYSPATGRFRATGNLHEARQLASATVLTDGRILLVGGYNANGPVASAELYDPQAGIFLATGSLLTPRLLHRATLLTDGRVLISGGAGPGFASLGSCELYSPVTGSFAATGGLFTARQLHTATRLTDGRILITGGTPSFQSTTALDSIEIYTPANGQFQTSGTLLHARQRHSATLLNSGEVLLAGGHSDTLVLDAETFRLAQIQVQIAVSPPAATLTTGTTQAFTASVIGTTNRQVDWTTTAVGAPALDGSITTDGVYTAPSTPGNYIVTATSVASPGVSISANVTVVSPPIGDDPNLAIGHSAHTATQLADGRILIAGGATQPFIDFAVPVTATAQLYDPGSNTLTPAGNLQSARAVHTATLLADHRVLVVGGEQFGTGSLDSAELFDPAGGNFLLLAAHLGTPRQGHSATRLQSGRVLIAGGYDGVGKRFLSTAELYDPTLGASGSFVPTGNLNARRQLHTATLLRDGRVLLAGGVTDGDGALATAELYDPTAGSFTPVPGSMRSPRFLHHADLLADGRVLITGGSHTLDRGASVLNTAEIYDPASNQFLPAGRMALPRYCHATVALPDGRIVVTGGSAFFEGLTGLNSVEVYDPSSDTFSTFVLHLSAPRQRHTVSLGASDRLVVAGGHDLSNQLRVENYVIGAVLPPPPPPPPPPPGGNDRYFPLGSEWARDISQAPLDLQSAQVISTLASLGGWGLNEMRIDFSLDVIEADANVPFYNFIPNGDFYTPDCDNVPMPVPIGGALEGEPNYQCSSDGDCHLIVVHRASQRLFEMFRANIVGGVAGSGPFYGGCLAVWDISRIYPASGRGEQCTSADAAGFPIAPLLFNADEIAAGKIDHAIRFILPNSRIQAGVYVRPATHAGNPRGPATAPPYGARFRLRADYPLNTLPSEATRIIARAMQQYGMILSDGGSIALTAQSDRYTTHKWNGVLGQRDLAQLQVTDFEMIDGGDRYASTQNCYRNQ